MSPTGKGPGQRDEFHLVESEFVFEGRLLRVAIERWRSPSGAIVEREVVRHPRAVAVVPLDADGNVTLVRQFRPATSQWLLEIPAGKIEPGETPAQTADRELAEEVGLVASEKVSLATFYSTPGFSDEILHLFVANDCSPHPDRPGGRPDGEEEAHLEKVSFPLREWRENLGPDGIGDAKTLLGLALAAQEYPPTAGNRAADRFDDRENDPSELGEGKS